MEENNLGVLFLYSMVFLVSGLDEERLKKLSLFGNTHLLSSFKVFTHKIL